MNQIDPVQVPLRPWEFEQIAIDAAYRWLCMAMACPAHLCVDVVPGCTCLKCIAGREFPVEGSDAKGCR